jgi:hypothetical protein
MGLSYFNSHRLLSVYYWRLLLWVFFLLIVLRRLVRLCLPPFKRFFKVKDGIFNLSFENILGFAVAEESDAKGGCAEESNAKGG